MAGLSEEFGWRGYALPLLQESYSGIYSACESQNFYFRIEWMQCTC
ncbi:MAG TPA: hypothetical protein GXX32_00590 [Methanothermobacter sp.]|nr:hypothetical protein [Methanothermobacter sp.]